MLRVMEVDGTPKPDAQRCFTDPDSRIMLKSGAVIQGYNAQIAVDGHAQIIVAEAITNQAPDTEHLPIMLDRVIENCGQVPEAFTADAGYFSERNVAECERRGIDAYIAVGRKLDDNAQNCPLGGSPVSSAQRTRDRMRNKLLTTRGKTTYALRKSTAEPPFGQIKEARGFRRFSLRSLDKVRSEWSLVCLTHNRLKLFRARSAATLPI